MDMNGFRINIKKIVFDMTINSLKSVRKTALKKFRQFRIPSSDHEEWKFTDPSPLIELSNACLKNGIPKNSHNTKTFSEVTKYTKNIDAHWIVLENGIIREDFLSPFQSMENTGFTVERFSEISDKSCIYIDDPMASLNAALLDDGLLINIKKNIEIEKPIAFLLFDETTSTNHISQSRIIVNANQNSKAEIIELQVSKGDLKQFTNSVIQIELLENSQIDFLKIQERSNCHMQLEKTLVTINRNATLNYTSVDIGGSLIRNDVITTMIDIDGKAQINGVYLSESKQHIDNHIVADHQIGETKSIINYRGIIGKNSRCIFNGKAIVQKNADGSDAHQSNKNILLSENAEINTKPELEIYADDVKCSHGTTIGQIDKQLLFYMQTRGINRAEAKRLLTSSFIDFITNKIEINSVKKYLENILKQKFLRLIHEM